MMSDSSRTFKIQDDYATNKGDWSKASSGNATGGAGMCPNCSIMPLRVLDDGDTRRHPPPPGRALR